MKQVLSAALAASIFLGTAVIYTHAQAPPNAPVLINYQGRLANNSGQPLGGATALEFRLFQNASPLAGGNAVWAETQSVEVQTDGSFNVILGQGTTIGANELADVVDGRALYLEIQVDANAPLFPRQQFLYAPYAVHARTADRVIGAALDSPIPIGMIMPYAGAIDSVPTGWLPCDGRVLSNQFIRDAGGLFTIPSNRHFQLFQVIKHRWGGVLNDASQFRVPDLRGMFLRGANTLDLQGNLRTDGFRDPDATVRSRRFFTDTYDAAAPGTIPPGFEFGDDADTGSFQGDIFRVHNHPLGETTTSNLDSNDGNAVDSSNETQGVRAGGGSAVRNSGGNESRPKNAYVIYIIRAEP